MFFNCRNRVFSAGCHLGGGGALYSHLNDASRNETALSQKFSQTTPQSANNAQNGLGLDPENDEIILTTQSGIEIKSHNASATGAESTIQYFTLGSYNSEPVNWLIVGVSANGIGTDATPAGTAIKVDSTNQKLVTGAVSTDLEAGQILCISEYAFNQEEYNPNFVAPAVYTYTFTNISTPFTYNLEIQCASTTNTFSKYYSNYLAPECVTASLNFGTLLNLNNFFGNATGMIVVNSIFSDNYIFSLNTSHYNKYVTSTNYKVPYLYKSEVATNVWANNTSISGTVTSSFGYQKTGNNLDNCYAYGTGAANANFNNYINSLGEGSSKYNIANFSAYPSNTGSYLKVGDYKVYHFKTTYSVTNYSISLAYRPAFVMQL